MGSGKSSVGQALAARLGWSFVDLDAEIETSERRKIRDIFRDNGEKRFRAIEARVLRLLLAKRARPFVLATGGGTFVQKQNAELLLADGVLVVFLEASAETLLCRCHVSAEAEKGVRPLARNREEFVKLYQERLPLYRRADLSVDSDSRSPEAVAREIVDALARM